ncbi:hypothetical protein F2Q70_00003020 [Brassica cretica]|uniref:Uncharacterized protein n=2 Tax=Brassica cretica TaxID=69181 RepID=A0A8S9IME3_BRACR|nr:hypothetical protein F2Q68_00020708 [Brassica cretica]KAF2570552.1 hypothetical protein F2Q70_00003020 [Brassica cretica]KAF3567210.1 hypothetical protein DY000_02014697 [Brassica cretica]
MAATLVLIQDANGELHVPEGHLHNAAGQKLDDQGAVIPESAAGKDVNYINEAAQYQ